MLSLSSIGATVTLAIRRDTRRTTFPRQVRRKGNIVAPKTPSSIDFRASGQLATDGTFGRQHIDVKEVPRVWPVLRTSSSSLWTNNRGPLASQSALHYSDKEAKSASAASHAWTNSRATGTQASGLPTWLNLLSRPERVRPASSAVEPPRCPATACSMTVRALTSSGSKHSLA